MDSLKLWARDGEAVRQAIAAGIRDVNELTNRAFFARHPLA
jgi:hypothetical protein